MILGTRLGVVLWCGGFVLLGMACGSSEQAGAQGGGAGSAGDAGGAGDAGDAGDAGGGGTGAADGGEVLDDAGGADVGGGAGAGEDAGEEAGGEASVTDAGDPTVCPTYANPVTAGYLLHFSVAEASGIVESRRNPGILWVHNDSGDSARIFGISTTGMARGTYVLEGANATDWEDIALGPGPVAGQSYIYVGDIGDNGESRPNVKVYRVPEPAVPAGNPTLTLSGVETFTLQYPDDSHNAETLLVDPSNGDLYIVAKSNDGVSPVFRAAAPLSGSGTMVMDLVTTLYFGEGLLPGDTTTTGGDISPSGTAIAIRTYDSAYVFRRPPGTSVAEALETEPCPVPLAKEGQGEALGFATDEGGYYTMGEGKVVPLSFYAKKE